LLYSEEEEEKIDIEVSKFGNLKKQKTLKHFFAGNYLSRLLQNFLYLPV
jgi:hypothetical protein